MKQAIYIAAAIPFFLLAIGLEAWVARRRRVSVYRFADAVAATFLLLLLQHDLPRPLMAGAAGLVLLSLLAWSGLTEGKRWGWPLELGRMALVLAAAAAALGGALQV